MNKCEPPDPAGKYQRDFKQCFLEQNLHSLFKKKKKNPHLLCKCHRAAARRRLGRLGGARLLLRAERSPRLGLGCGSSPGLSLRSVTAERGFLRGDHCLHASHKDFPCTSAWSAAGRGAEGSVTLAAPGEPPGLRKSGPNEGIAGAKCKTGGVMVAAGDTQFSGDSLELGLSLSQTLWDQRV